MTIITASMHKDGIVLSSNLVSTLDCHDYRCAVKLGAAQSGQRIRRRLRKSNENYMVKRGEPRALARRYAKSCLSDLASNNKWLDYTAVPQPMMSALSITLRVPWSKHVRY